tara:strand:- start:171 stop:362 length:192 start_codon:yes stop_codon:yes gene_type:complete
MVSKNDITGDSIQSKHTSQKKYSDNWEKIFGKKENKNNIEPIKNDGPPMPNGLKGAWERKDKK